jgi:hypothetical protein
MPSTSAEDELTQFLRAIENGSITLRPEQEPQDVYAGNVSYAASNGWRIVVYNDANEWDYIDSVTPSDGRVFDCDALNEMPTIEAYEPRADIAWTRYGIPGYRLFRCKVCGTRLRKEQGRSMCSPFICTECQSK